jgi:hypothetical protein
MLSEKLDKEFKMYCRWRGVNIDGSIFELAFCEPQNFSTYKQAEVDSAKVQTFTSLEQVPYLSKRFLLKRYLGLTEEEMAENDDLWQEEKGDASESTPGDVGLRGVGVTPGGIETDMSMADSLTPPDEGGMLGAEPAPGAAGIAPVPGAAPAAAGPPGMAGAPTA